MVRFAPLNWIRDHGRQAPRDAITAQPPDPGYGAEPPDAIRDEPLRFPDDDYYVYGEGLTNAIRQRIAGESAAESPARSAAEGTAVEVGDAERARLARAAEDAVRVADQAAEDALDIATDVHEERAGWARQRPGVDVQDLFAHYDLVIDAAAQRATREAQAAGEAVAAARAAGTELSVDTESRRTGVDSDDRPPAAEPADHGRGVLHRADAALAQADDAIHRSDEALAEADQAASADQERTDRIVRWHAEDTAAQAEAGREVDW